MHAQATVRFSTSPDSTFGRDAMAIGKRGTARWALSREEVDYEILFICSLDLGRDKFKIKCPNPLSSEFDNPLSDFQYFMPIPVSNKFNIKWD